MVDKWSLLLSLHFVGSLKIESRIGLKSSAKRVAELLPSRHSSRLIIRALYCKSYVSMTFIMFCVLQTAGEGHQWDGVDIPPVVPEGCFQSGVSVGIVCGHISLYTSLIPRLHPYMGAWEQGGYLHIALSCLGVGGTL